MTDLDNLLKNRVEEAIQAVFKIEQMLIYGHEDPIRIEFYGVRCQLRRLSERLPSQTPTVTTANTREDK